MADLPRNPIPQATWNDPGLYGGVEVQGSLIFSGLCGYVEAGERTLQASPPTILTERMGSHLVCVEDNKITSDPTAADDVGRWMELYTIGGSALPVGFGFGRKLAGLQNTDPPDFATYKGFVGMVDGEGRAVASGDGQQLKQYTRALSSGSIRQAVQLGFDGTSTFVTHFDSISGGNPYIGNITQGDQFNGVAVGAIAYYAGFEPFGSVRLMPQGLSNFTGTVVWEYWNGAWTAIPNVTDGTNSFNNPTAPASPALFVTFPPQDDWATTTVNGFGPLYFVRARITVVGTGTPTNFAYGDQFQRVLRENVDMFDGTAALQKIGDVAYWGGVSTYDLLRLAHNNGSAGNLAVAWEYWNGAWIALPGLSDGTSAFSAGASPQDVAWTPIPGDWVTRTLVIFAGHTTDLLFFIRARLTAVTTPIALSSPTATTKLPTTGVVPGAGPVCFDIGAKPGVTGERDPEIIGWGIALPSGVVADPAGLYTYWDPIRQIHSRRFDPATAGNYIPSHGEAHVSEIAQWSDATALATLVGTGATGAQLNIDTTTADTSIAIGADSGPPVFFDETKPQDERDFSLQGYTACVLRNRVYIAHGNRVIWTERGEFHQVAPANGIDIAPNDGDQVTAIYSFAEKVIVFKQHHIYALVGEPSVGTTGIDVAELSNEIGCIAKRTIVDVGAQLLFFSQSGIRQMDANALPQPIEVSEPVRDIFSQALARKGAVIHQAVAAWEPSKQLYMISMPGLQEQLTDGSRPNVDALRNTNDGMMVYCRRNGQWAMWAGQPQGFGSLVTYWRSSTERAVAAGDYWGELFVLKEQAAEGDRVASNDTMGDLGAIIGRTGTVDADPSFVAGRIIDTGAFLVEGTDTRLIGTYVLMLSGKQAGRVGRVERSSADEVRTAGNISVVEVGDRYAIGNIYWYADTGDLVWGSPAQERAVRSARPIFNGNPLGQPTDIGVDSTSARDQAKRQSGPIPLADADRESFKMAGGTVTVPVQGGTPRALALGGRRGMSARIRVAGRIGAGAPFQDGDSKPRIRQLIIDGRTFGRAGST